MPTPRTLLLASALLAVALVTVAAFVPPIGGGSRRAARGVGTPAVPVPTIPVSIGTVRVGRGEPFRVTFPASDEARRLLSTGRIVVQSDVVDLAYERSAPGSPLGSVTLTGTTRHVTPCDSFETGVAVEIGGREALHLELSARVRRAFTIRPIVAGRRYALALAPGVRPPRVTARSTGWEAAVVATGPASAELVLTRTGTPRLPGGTVRLLDRASGDTQLVRLPPPPVPSWGVRTGSLLDADGDLHVAAQDQTIRDRPDVAVVLDPPGAYAVLRRGTERGVLALTLRPLTSPPVDLRVGFRRKGRWIELQEFEPAAP